jgi:hypothetical protein
MQPKNGKKQKGSKGPTTQNAGNAHNLLQGPPSAPLISKYLFNLT